MNTPITLSDTDKKYLTDLLKKYETKRAALLPVLHFLQQKVGFVNNEVEEYAAEFLELPIIKVREVTSFYTLFHKKKPGKYHIQVCRSIGCFLQGCDNLLKQCENKLGIQSGEVTPDGKYSLSHVECLAACDKGPVIRINDDYVVNVSPEKIAQIIEEGI